jgi:hypothetical protein
MVYHGYVDDTQVAVKMLSPSSVQGYQQFQAEACPKTSCRIMSLIIYIHVGTKYDFATQFVGQTSYESSS